MIKTMRDAFLEELFEKMKQNEKIIIISVDFGAPVLDKIRKECPKQVINIGIAEQNAVNVGVGLALEGFIVYIYAIAPFISMRAFEQIRVNMAILSEFRKMRVNIIAVAVGMSYSTSGATHHCLEDLSIIKTLPNIEIFSPSDYLLARGYVERSLNKNGAKYIRLDGSAGEALKNEISEFDKGFRVLQDGNKLCIISTSYMSASLTKLVAKYPSIKLIDLYLINAYDYNCLKKELENFSTVITVEEGFKNAGGLDAEINFNFKDKKIINIGLKKKYCLDVGGREFLHEKCEIDTKSIERVIKECL